MSYSGSGTLTARPARKTAGSRQQADYPRLVRIEPAVPTLRRSLIGSIGNNLAEAPWLLWNAFDSVVVAIGVYLGHLLFVWTPEGGWLDFGWGRTSLIQCFTFLTAGLVFGLYEQQTLLRRSRLISRSILTITAAVTLTSILVYVFMYAGLSRRAMVVSGAFYLAAAMSIRLLVCWSISRYSRKFLIVGTHRSCRLRPKNMGDGLSRRYQLAGYVTTDSIEVGTEIDGYRVLGTIDNIEHICLEHEVNEVVVGPGPARNARVLDNVLGCLKLGCRVTNLSTFYEQVLSEVPIDHLEPHWFLFADLKHYREAQLMMKRAFDIFGAVLGLLLTLPFWPLIALVIKMDSPGPVFYYQRRVGLNGRVFCLRKFRTMYQGAEQNGHTWAAVNDSRVTTVGWYLRHSRLDELPQLWNILLGQMSVVGPRPERPEFVGELAEKIRFYNERHLIKPGLTGWAQISYPYGASVEDARRKLQLDLWYIKHMSLELDLVILLRTLGTMCLGSR